MQSFSNDCGVVFDLDGTLLDSLSSIAIAMNEALKKLNFEPLLESEYGKIIGRGIDRLISAALPESHMNKQDTILECKDLFEICYEECWEAKSSLYPDVPEALDFLQKNRVPMAILSNKPDAFVQKIIRHFFSEWDFCSVYGSLEDYPLKPSPELLFKVVESMNISMSNIYYVGDTEVDIELANRASCLSVGALWGFRGKKLSQKCDMNMAWESILEVKSLLN
ncbi:hypothetical protein AB834_04675 [PVC group bacterium (ex Bugula neritina AB1)]|nr:hypothetical protein AB834_04675 [PVC group bacterium (ex Bugula neritina AB1)]